MSKLQFQFSIQSMYENISFLAPLSQLNSYFVNKNLGLFEC